MMSNMLSALSTLFVTGSNKAGSDEAEKSFHLAAWWFVRAIALIYLAAFLSMASQITGLVGENGILPVGPYLEHVKAILGEIYWYRLPNLFWLDHSDAALFAVCFAGAVFSVLLFLGRLQLLSAIACFVLYLSVFNVGQIFLHFQWDTLLLEAGFLTILLILGYSRLVIFLFHWLLFRLRFLSGLSKLHDPSWTDLTTLNYYFETQPLPHIGAWYFHQLPEWLLRTGTGFTLFVELVVPFFIFLPRKFRLFAAFSTILLQLLIIASSNHNWINLLTIALCLFLLDDRLLSTVSSASLFNQLKVKSTLVVTRVIHMFAVVILVSTGVASAANYFLRDVSLHEGFMWVRAYGLGHAFHVFPTIQLERYEFDVQGSMDGNVWKSYRFKYKPNDEKHIPDFIMPHQPRLDWMIWFVPSKHADMQYWFMDFLDGLYQNRSEVTALLADNPFKDKAPKYIRVLTYKTRFTTADEFNASGNYWKAEYLGVYPNVPPRRP